MKSSNIFEVNYMSSLSINSYIYMVSNRTSMTLFESIESAQHYVASFPATVSGGMTISKVPVFSEYDEKNTIQHQR